MGFETASPIQAALIPKALTGADCIGQARTGTGKTAAFVIPILQNMDRKASHLQALILAPTRELTEQVDGEFQMLAGKAPVKSVLVVGGKPIRAQVDALGKYPQVVVGTPGRVMDLMKYLPDVETMHGDLAQNKRDRVMKKLRKGKARLVIATDVVGRGIDISGISHIINYDIPQGSDDYVHRVGRTGRMSSDSEGRAFTLVTPEQGVELTRIEMLINTLLHEYSFDDYKAFEAKRVKTVEEDAYVETSFASGSDWDNILDEL
ncbi:UNVERIFIED_CONTAM: hypothetical protein GTU68_017535 [Idotea baltica]|nr:hypothetical protein [Idotea baltica]